MRKQIATFGLGESVFGIDVLLIKEISRIAELTPIPEAQDGLVGLMNLRGQIVTVFDLSKILDYHSSNDKGGERVFIVKTQPEIEPFITANLIANTTTSNDPAAFMIDTIEDVLEIDESEILPPPANQGGLDRELLSGVLKIENEIIPLLDLEVIINKTKTKSINK
ncbi:MAG: chemotaxis protein CheW [Pseudomonadota bacterium]